MTDKTKKTAQKLGKGATAIAVAAVAVYGALKPEEVARQAITANTVSHKALAKRVDALQTWVKANREASTSAGEACQAKVEALTSFVSGYLVALNRPTSRRAATQAPKEIKALVRALGGGKRRPRPVQRKLPKLAPAPKAPVFQKGR